MVAAAVVWIGLVIGFALLTGIGLGRHWERKDRTIRDRLLDEADEHIASMHALDRVRSSLAKW